MAKRRSFTLLAPLAGLSLLAAPLAAPAGAAAGDDPVLAGAIAFLDASQEEDGGFEVADFAGFETADAVLAIGLGAQPGPLDPAAGRARIEAVTSDTGDDGFDAIDDELDAATAAGGLAAGRAAKLVTLVARPFGFDARAFDPAGDGAPVDLLAAIDGGLDAGGGYGTFSDTLYAVLALRSLDRTVGAGTTGLIRAGQQANGGWDFAGDATGEDIDIDVTALAIQALVAVGAGASDTDVSEGLGLLGTTHDGGWGDETGVNPNSTALAIMAITAAGYDADGRCWRDVHAPATTGAGYGSPTAALRAAQAPDGRIASPFDSFGINTFATSQSAQALSLGWLPIGRAPAAPCGATTYATVNAAAGVTRFTQGRSGVAVSDQSLASPVVGAADLPGGTGTWLFSADGTVATSGDAPFLGRVSALAEPIVGGAAAPDGRGYWLVAADGGVFAFGSARFLGSTGDRVLNQPVVGMAATPDGGGYWLVAADGGIFSFGSAAFSGSAGGTPLNRPVVGMAADADGSGYWLAASDGGVFAYDARFAGSTGSVRLDRPVVGVAGTATGAGYVLAAADGGVFTFGDAPFLGSSVGRSPVDTVAVTLG